MSDVRDDRSGADVDAGIDPSGAPAADSWASVVRGPGTPTPAPGAAPGAAPAPAPAGEPFDARAGLGSATPPTPTSGKPASGKPASGKPTSGKRTRPTPAPAPPPAQAPRRGRPPTGPTGAAAGPERTGQRSRRRTRRARREAARRAQQAARAAAPRRRHRILPRTVIGISLLLLAFGLGTAASGVALFMYYQDKTDSSIAATKDFSARVDQSIAAIEAEGNNARAQVQSELEPLRKLAATGETLGTVMNAAGPSVWEVRTFGVDGAPLIASAFVVASDADKSFLVSAFTPLRAATSRPGPAVTIGKNGRTIPAELWTWDEANDLALLIVEEGNLPKLEWADPDRVRLGDQLFAVSGLGAKGAAVTQGFVADVSSKGVQHTAPIGSTFEGGPLLTADAKVVAVATLGYAPFGARSTGAVSMAPPIRAACSVVLRCPNGQVTSAGRQR